MNEALAHAVILIPSLEPDDCLPAYVDKLMASGFCHVVIVDDGSSEKTQPIFDSLDAKPGCKVVHHDVNHGKGVALKTGYAYIAKELPECTAIITADADGQHTVTDCIRLAEALQGRSHVLLLGSRDFSLPNIPPRSRFGNRCTSTVFKLFYGQWLPDTQTGLRAFTRDELTFMQEVAGERYEYEMNVLIACARAKIPMETITIETVYENNNEGSHFHPIRDSWRIYKVILGSFFKFAGVSILSFLLDSVLVVVLARWLLPLFGLDPVKDLAVITGVSDGVARVISALFNFGMNRKIVFKSNASVGKTLLRYIALAVPIMGLTAAIDYVLQLIGLPIEVAHPLTSTLLSILSYRFQDAWVFADNKRVKQEEQA